MPAIDRKQQALRVKLDDHDFTDQDVLSLLAEMDIDQIIRTLGEPRHFTEYATAQGWKVGDGRPSVANDDPAVMQSVGRCAAARVRWSAKPNLSFGSVHPASCDWCDYPIEELLKACSWSVHQSGYVVADVLLWEGKERSTYARPAGGTGYQNPGHRIFWELPAKERERRIEVASGRKVAP